MVRLRTATQQRTARGTSWGDLLREQFDCAERACFVVRDDNDQQLAYVYFEDGMEKLGVRTVADLVRLAEKVGISIQSTS